MMNETFTIFQISSSITVESCFSYSQSVNLLFLFDSVMFCSVSLSFFLHVCNVNVSHCYVSVVFLQPVAKWSIHLPKSEVFLDNTLYVKYMK